MSETTFKYLVINEETPFEEISPLRDLGPNGLIQLEMLHQFTTKTDRIIELLEEIKNNTG